MNIQKKITFAVMLCALCAVFLVSCSKKAGGLTIKPGTLTIGMEISYPPLEYYDDDGQTPIGFDVDMGRALAKELGLEVEFVDAEFDGLFGGLKVGKFDALISGVTITEERKAEFAFSKPYIGNAMTIVIRNDAPFRLGKAEEIAGHRVSFQEGTTAEIYTNKIREAGYDFQAYKYASVMNCFDDLKFKRVDIVVVDSLVAFEYIERDPNLYMVTYQGQADEYMGICIKKENDSLVSKINSALDKLRKSGELSNISLKYFKMDLVSQLNN